MSAQSDKIRRYFLSIFLSPSKDYERSLRQESGFQHCCPQSNLTVRFLKELKNIHIKLVYFFIQHCASDEMVPFIENKQIFINLRQFHSYIVDDNKSLSSSLPCPEHEEADSKIVFHVCNIDAQANFVIRCSDTDIAIIMLEHKHNLKNDDSNVWL